MAPRLSESQKEYLDKNYKLIFHGIKRISQRRRLNITEDEVNECVVRVLKQFPSHDASRSKESTYLYRNCDFALRKTTDDRKSASKKPKYIQFETADIYDSAVEDPDPFDNLHPDLKVDLEDAMGRLPVMWVDILHRRILNKESYPSISSSYGMSNSWAQSIVRNALLQLKMELYHWRDHDDTRPRKN